MPGGFTHRPSMASSSARWSLSTMSLSKSASASARLRPSELSACAGSTNTSAGTSAYGLGAASRRKKQQFHPNHKHEFTIHTPKAHPTIDFTRNVQPRNKRTKQIHKSAAHTRSCIQGAEQQIRIAVHMHRPCTLYPGEGLYPTPTVPKILRTASTMVRIVCVLPVPAVPKTMNFNAGGMSGYSPCAWPSCTYYYYCYYDYYYDYY